MHYVFKRYLIYIWPAHQTGEQNLCMMPRRWKAFTLSDSFQDPAASETADVRLKQQKLKDTKLQTQSLQEQMSKTEGCSTWFSCDMCEMPRQRKAFTLINSVQDPAASETADVPLEWQRLKDTKLQTQSLQETFNKTARCSTWFSCDICEYKCKRRGNLKQHLAQKHNINVKWFSCNICKYKCKLRSHLKTHLAHVHDVNVNWHSCSMCEYKCKTRGQLKQHLAHKHHINVTWFSCDKCEFKTTSRGHLKTHLAHVHDINIKWYSCHICEYKCKNRGRLNGHEHKSTLTTWNRCRYYHCLFF